MCMLCCVATGVLCWGGSQETKLPGRRHVAVLTVRLGWGTLVPGTTLCLLVI